MPPLIEDESRIDRDLLVMAGNGYIVIDDETGDISVTEKGRRAAAQGGGVAVSPSPVPPSGDEIRRRLILAGFNIETREGFFATTTSLSMKDRASEIDGAWIVHDRSGFLIAGDDLDVLAADAMDAARSAGVAA